MDYPQTEELLKISKSSDEGGNDDLEVDNSKSVLLKIATLYAEQLMSDMVLEVGGVGYPAHRLILCASSEVFQVMLMNREWSEWRESRVILQETPTAASVFPHFLKYFYTGQIRISYNTVLPVLSLADKYNVKDLVILCLEYMSQHIALAAKRGHLIAWMQYTMACGHNSVAKECQNFVKWNMEGVWSGTDLSELDDETLLLLLQQSDLVLLNEMKLYRLVVSWLMTQRERFELSELTEGEVKMHWDTLVTTVLSYIRFPMMCPNQLANLLLCPLTQEYKEFFMERMAIAMSYQSGQNERVTEIQQTEQGRTLFTPRLYTEDMWGSILSVDNFHSLPSYHTRTFIFSTKPSIADVASDGLTEWTVDLYPKGVWFKKSMLIAWSGNYDVPEVVLRTVRISITCQNGPEVNADVYSKLALQEPDIRVKIGILVWGVQNGVEHIANIVERVHRFNAQSKVLNIDDALDFDELNTPLYTPASANAGGNVSTVNMTKHNSHCSKCTENCAMPEPRHLLGIDRDQLRIQVIIVPLTEFCHVAVSGDPHG
ncbi:BTB/POZ domain-containing protein 17 [Leptidea sinapis]|uniref:BTB/POZ domain-containing protein 17 n=1 Tax=Leptidea sinapis TaxID=189913 RepID=UPI002147112B|nr:BTB/POZ domain-containing protein 17 [Leptidea sinapis]